MRNWEWNLPNKITGTQTSFSTNFGDKLSFIPSFLFPERLHCCYIFSLLLPVQLNYSRTLCIKCWVSAFHTDNTERGDRGWREGDFTDNFIVIRYLCSLQHCFTAQNLPASYLVWLPPCWRASIEVTLQKESHIQVQLLIIPPPHP
jgi:hypothetical protein